MKQEIITEATNAAPPVTLTAAAAIMGITLNEWVAVATLAYIIVQAGYLLWKWWKEYRRSE